jgi:kynurenine formamidase
LNLSAEAEAVLMGSRVFDLSQPIKPGMPIGWGQPPFSMVLARRYGDVVYDDGVSTATELLVMSSHAGTHIDALGHASRSGRVHGGSAPPTARPGGAGLAILGIEGCQPVICPGILIDVPAAKGVEILNPGQEITIADLQEALESESQRIEPKSAVLVRTGWARHWNDRESYLGVDRGTPGLGANAASWLANLGISVTGSDTIAYEAIQPDRRSLPVHGILLVDKGIPIIETMNLEQLAAERIYRFLFIAIPLRIVGATGSPIRPIAIA